MSDLRFNLLIAQAMLLLKAKKQPVAINHSQEWRTINGGESAETGEKTGRHIQIDTETGVISKGFGAGKTLKEAFNPEPKTERQKIGRKFAAAGAAKHGGNERDYRNLGVTKGQADSFANQYLKSGTLPSDIQIQQDDKDWHSLNHTEKTDALVDKLGMSKKEAAKMANYALASPFRDRNTHLDDVLNEPEPAQAERDKIKQFHTDRYTKELTDKGIVGEEHAKKLKEGFLWDKLDDDDWDYLKSKMDERPSIDERDKKVSELSDKVKGIIKEHGAHSDQANSYFNDVLSKESSDIQDKVKNTVMNDDDAYKSIVQGKSAQSPTESEEQGFNNLHPAAAIIGRENYDKLHSGKPIEVEFNDLRTGEPKTANITRNQSESGLPYYTVSDGKSSYDVGEKQWLDLVERGEYKVKEQSLIESQKAENNDDIYGYQESTKKPYSVKEQYGKKHYRIKGKDIPFDTDFSKDYAQTKEGDNKYFLRDSEGQVLRDNSEHPSALVFKTENAANSFVSAMNEIKKDNGIKSQATKIVKEPNNEITHEELIAKRRLENPTQLLDPSKPTDIRTVEEKKKSLESKHIRDVNPNELKGKAKAWAIEEKAKYAKEIEGWNNENPEHRIEL